ncbi:hypothetical protein GBAR_LOCUS13722 [Geodia barretti]|uniref:Secreted protein n=1 Tax=Geodia barretti TaxID=519541 RepID=A0AA35WR18_GEOBA|nr:hypothetical protein GBAR_LOCUS13722 [Geodia barretti]
MLCKSVPLWTLLATLCTDISSHTPFSMVFSSSPAVSSGWLSHAFTCLVCKICRLQTGYQSPPDIMRSVDLLYLALVNVMCRGCLAPAN